MHYILAPKPLWLAWTGEGTWVTVAPYIYHPKGVDPSKYAGLIEHEKQHIKQQTEYPEGLWAWIKRYYMDADFRLKMEAEAAAAELITTDYKNWKQVFQSYCWAFSGKLYMDMANYQSAGEAIIKAYDELLISIYGDSTTHILNV